MGEMSFLEIGFEPFRREGRRASAAVYQLSAMALDIPYAVLGNVRQRWFIIHPLGTFRSYW